MSSFRSNSVSIPVANALRSARALLLVVACTWVLEILSLMLVTRGQVLAPHAFFTHQSWDFLAKVRWLGDGLLSWAPMLPDQFAGPGAAAKLAPLAMLLPATAVVALLLAILGGALCFVLHRRPRSTRSFVLHWTALALIIHGIAALPALGLDEGLRLGHLAYRARSLVIDGTLVATVVALLAGALAWIAMPRLERSRAATGGLAAAMVVAVLLAATGAPAPGESAVPAAGDRSPSDERFNVLLISLDSLRADHVGAYGYHRDTTPAFDRLAREGILFRDAVATSSWTLPTHLTMFTGRYQLSHGVVEDTRILTTSIPTLGQIFRSAGYQTAGFASGPYLAGHYGYERGMDTYEDLSAAWGKGPEARAAILSPDINAKALAWIEELGEAPFFLFLHYFDIHYDYVSPPPYDTMFDPDYTGTFDGKHFIERDDVHKNMDPRDLEHIKALYDGEIRFTDDHVARVLDHLRNKGLLDSTVVMIVSDHGDEFFEHGNKGHHRTVYEEVTAIPFAMRLPRGAHAGTVVEEQVSLVDVLPTLLDAAGLPPLPDVEGISLLPVLRGQPSGREAVYAEFYNKKGFNVQVARRTKAHKTIQHFNRITHPKRGAIEFYDMQADPGEKRDLATSRRDDAQTSLSGMSQWLEEQWRAQRRSETAAGGRSSIRIDDETMERLKSLGYVGD